MTKYILNEMVAHIDQLIDKIKYAASLLIYSFLL